MQWVSLEPGKQVPMNVWHLVAVAGVIDLPRGVSLLNRPGAHHEFTILRGLDWLGCIEWLANMSFGDEHAVAGKELVAAHDKNRGLELVDQLGVLAGARLLDGLAHLAMVGAHGDGYNLLREH